MSGSQYKVRCGISDQTAKRIKALESEAIIERIMQVGAGVQRLALAVHPALLHSQAGQILLARVGSAWEPYLREAWIPIGIQDGLLIVERHAVEHYSPGQTVSLIGPVGQALPWISGKDKHLLLIAYDAPPSHLLMLADEALAQGAEVALILIGRAQSYPYQGIPEAVEVINGLEDGTWPHLDETLAWADQVFAVADDAFWVDYYTALYNSIRNSLTLIPVNFLYGLFALPLPCGTGACMACMIRCKTSNKLACLQGLALDLTEVQLLG